MNVLYLSARVLEVIDLLIVALFSVGYFVPFKFRKFRAAHLTLTWSVLVAQLCFGFRCPILICANELRKMSGCEEIAVKFQPTFLNFLAGFSNPEIANTFMTIAILTGPFVASILYRYQLKRGRPAA
mgnify:CR=1 FL=1